MFLVSFLTSYQRIPELLIPSLSSYFTYVNPDGSCLLDLHLRLASLFVFRGSIHFRLVSVIHVHL